MKSRTLRLGIGVLGFLLHALGTPPAANGAPVTLQNGTATCSQNDFTGNYPVDEAVDGVVNTSDGWAIFCNGSQALPQTAVFETTYPVMAASGLNRGIGESSITEAQSCLIPDRQIGR